MKRLVSARRRLGATTLLLTFSFVAASFANAGPAAAVTSSESKMASYINHARDARGIRTMKVNSSLSYLARKHSEAMANAGEIYHTSNLGYKLRNYTWTVAGENVGRGPSLIDIHRAMMASEGHRANILYSTFRSVGVGIVWRNGRAYVTEMFLG
jgi:uncharacterized protein YkwD